MIIQRLMLILLIGLVTGCGANPTAQPTPKPTATEPPEEIEEPEVADDASPGEILFKQFISEAGFACGSCHYLNTDDRLLGPGLLGIEDRFETYDIEVDNLESYIKQSIIDPSMFIVPDESPYPEHLMPRNYGDIFTEDDLDVLVGYILSFK